MVHKLPDLFVRLLEPNGALQPPHTVAPKVPPRIFAGSPPEKTRAQAAVPVAPPIFVQLDLPNSPKVNNALPLPRP